MAFYDLKYLEDTFIHYVKQNTRSYEENHDQVPSSPDQVKMGKELAKALKEIGLVAYYNEKNGFAIGHLKKNVEDDVTPIGFSHILIRLISMPKILSLKFIAIMMARGLL